MIRDENYYMVHGWMLNKLKLKGVQLSVYAIIFGFSQDGETEFTGSLQYLCDFTGSSKPTIIKALKELVENDLITCRKEVVNGIQFNRYKINVGFLQNFTGSKESLLGSKETLLGGSKESLHNNIYNNTNNIIKDNITSITKKEIVPSGKPSSRRGLFNPPPSKEPKLDSKAQSFIQSKLNIADEFEFCEIVTAKLAEFFEMLAQSKTYLPDVSIRAQLEDLVEFTEMEQLQIVSDTIKSGWKSLKYSVERIQKSNTPSFDTAKPGSFQPKDPTNDKRWEQYEDDVVF